MVPYNGLMTTLVCPSFSYFRTGSIIVGMLEEGGPIQAYLVLTVWPKQQKPKPTPMKISIAAVKCFRAVQLLQQEGNVSAGGVLVPTNLVLMLEAHNVLAILDAESSEVVTGKIAVTEESWRVLESMQSEDFDRPSLPKKRRKRQPAKDSRQNAVKKIIEKKKKQNVLEPSTGKPTASSKDDASEAMAANQAFIANDFRRSVPGRKAIMEVIKKFRCLDNLKFETPVFNTMTDVCTLNGFESVVWKQFLAKSAKFYESKFAFSARTPAHYGEKVFSELISIHRALVGSPANREPWTKLVRNVSKYLDAGTVL